MIFRIGDRSHDLEAYSSSWNPKELEVENYILPSQDSEDGILHESVFGEPLLLICNQVTAKYKKRADILALDQGGSAVIIELKRGMGTLGVDTQALQYLADFSAYKGTDFIDRFCEKDPSLEARIRGFLGDNIELKHVNRQSRIILLARGFDPSLFSMGEWLSTCGVAFRCVEYTPFEVGSSRFLSFSVAFDRSPGALYTLAFQNRSREPECYWHNIGEPTNEWWSWLRNNGKITTSFSNQPGDQGERILKGYISGDKIVAYAKGFGAIGWGVCKGPTTYRLLGEDDELGPLRKPGHRHRLDVDWQATAKNIDGGLSAEAVREEYGIYHPVSTSVKIGAEKAEKLIAAMNHRFRS